MIPNPRMDALIKEMCKKIDKATAPADLTEQEQRERARFLRNREINKREECEFS